MILQDDNIIITKLLILLFAFPFVHFVGVLANSIRKKSDIYFGVYHALFEWFNPLYIADKNNGFRTQNFATVSWIIQIIMIFVSFNLFTVEGKYIFFKWKITSFVWMWTIFKWEGVSGYCICHERVILGTFLTWPLQSYFPCTM